MEGTKATLAPDDVHETDLAVSGLRPPHETDRSRAFFGCTAVAGCSWSKGRVLAWIAFWVLPSIPNLEYPGRNRCLETTSVRAGMDSWSWIVADGRLVAPAGRPCALRGVPNSSVAGLCSWQGSHSGLGRTGGPTRSLWRRRTGSIYLFQSNTSLGLTV